MPRHRQEFVCRQGRLDQHDRLTRTSNIDLEICLTYRYKPHQRLRSRDRRCLGSTNRGGMNRTISTAMRHIAHMPEPSEIGTC